MNVNKWVNYIFPLCAIVALPMFCEAQTQINFEYDGFGNRILRYVPDENASNYQTKSESFDETDGFWSEVEETENVAVKVYPNPTQDNLFVDFENIESGKYELTSSVGTVLQKGDLQMNNILSLKDYSSGIYYLKITTDEGEEVLEIVKE